MSFFRFGARAYQTILPFSIIEKIDYPSIEYSIGDKDMDLEFWSGKEKVDKICSVGHHE